ncbi:MAG: hypothetical protein ACO4CG_16215 [Prochlorothrix sp.]
MRSDEGVKLGMGIVEGVGGYAGVEEGLGEAILEVVGLDGEVGWGEVGVEEDGVDGAVVVPSGGEDEEVAAVESGWEKTWSDGQIAVIR